jgi:hypothetical protein
MIEVSNGKVYKTASRRLGILVVIAAGMLAGAPFVVKAYLRATIPPVWLPDAKVQYAATTAQYLESERDSALKKVMVLATQLESSKPRKSVNEQSKYQDAVMRLNVLDLRLVGALKGTIAEGNGFLGQIIERERARRLIEHRARRLDEIVIVCVTFVMAMFMFFLKGSSRVPRWAKEISAVMAGAVLAGWFPL